MHAKGASIHASVHPLGFCILEILDIFKDKKCQTL